MQGIASTEVGQPTAGLEGFSEEKTALSPLEGISEACQSTTEAGRNGLENPLFGRESIVSREFLLTGHLQGDSLNVTYPS